MIVRNEYLKGSARHKTRHKQTGPEKHRKQKKRPITVFQKNGKSKRQDGKEPYTGIRQQDTPEQKIKK